MADRLAELSHAIDPDWASEPDVGRLRQARRMLTSDRARALRDLGELADQGSVMSMVYIAWEFSRGEERSRDLVQAKLWYRRAIKSGSSIASFHLGLLYISMSDFDRAFEAFKIGDEKDFAPSIYRLGRMYFNGQGVVADRGKAEELWERAAALGHVYAKRNVALSMMSGKYGALKFPNGVALWLSALSDIYRLGSINRDSYLLR